MATLYLYVDDPEIASLYASRSVCHPNYVPDLTEYPDSGFDLICLEDTEIKAGEQAKFDFQVRGLMEDADNSTIRRGYFIVPRSSFNDTPLVMQNSPGIIDAAYTGTLRMKVRALADCTIKRGTCLAQIVHPSLLPFAVRILSDRPPTTKRGEGGFGSTGNTYTGNA